MLSVEPSAKIRKSVLERAEEEFFVRGECRVAKHLAESVDKTTKSRKSVYDEEEAMAEYYIDLPVTDLRTVLHASRFSISFVMRMRNVSVQLLPVSCHNQITLDAEQFVLIEIVTWVKK